MRFSPHTPGERREMLQVIGKAQIDELFADIPPGVRLGRPLDLPRGLSEMELVRHMRALSQKNRSLGDMVSFLGAGVYDRFIPAAVDELVRRSEFYTSYTPYQPEISQGTLQAIYEFQSMICRLTGLPVAQASLYDGASAVAEAAMLACAHQRRRKVLVARTVDPQYRAVLRTYARGQGVEVAEVACRQDGRLDLEQLQRALEAGEVACVMAAQPNFFGLVEDMEAPCGLAHAHGALFVAVVDPVSLALLKPPGAYGADLAVGEGQSLGLPPAFGGPYLGFMAATRALIRRLPGRIAGVTADGAGRRGYVLTLQTREQHIRRERATSNICTNQGLCALAATIYLALLGKSGLRSVAGLSLEGAHALAPRLEKLPGVQAAFPGAPFFQEFVVRLARPAGEVQKRLAAQGIIGGLALERYYPELGSGAMLLAVTEKRTAAEMDALVEALEGIL